MSSYTNSARCIRFNCIEVYKTKAKEGDDQQSAKARAGEKAWGSLRTHGGGRLIKERGMEAICAGTKERHDATHPAKLILQLSHRARKEGCRKACWMRTCPKGGSARYVDQVRK